MLDASILPINPTPKKFKITNKAYRKFLDEGVIQTLTDEQVQRILLQIKHKNLRQAKALFLLLYFTGARPNEILRMRSKDIILEKPYIKVKVVGSKKGLPRTIYLKYNNPLVKQIYYYSAGLVPDIMLFYNFISTYKRPVMRKSGNLEYRTELSTKVYYYIKRWTKGVLGEHITPYYLRHNRFSNLSEKGISMEQLRMLKGSRTLDSVTPYLHMSSETAKKVAKKIN